MSPSPKKTAKKTALRQTTSRRTPRRRVELTLEDLVSIVSAIVPEAEVGPTVCALFARGIASFDGPLAIEERTELAKAC